MMLRAPLLRLLNMPRHELRWRTRAHSRIVGQRLAYALRRPRWHREAIERALVPGLVDVRLRRAIAAGDWRAVHAALRDQIRAREPRYPLDPWSSSRIRQEVVGRWPEAPGEAARRADRLLARTYDLLGYRGVACTDWHSDPVNGGRMPSVFWAHVPYLDPRCGDHKVIWELNRHQHFLALGRAAWLTGNSRYADAIVGDLASWLDDNPPLTGANWASMLEIGLRCLSWLWALHALLGSDEAAKPADGRAWLVDMLVGLDRQLVHVADNLSTYFSPNTHLTGEALALYVVGHALPELARSAEWLATGRRVLIAEAERQVGPDGGHVERSMHYQRYTLDFYLLALQTAEINGDARAVRAFQPVCARLAEFTLEMADDQGRLPLIGDDDGGMLWPIAGREPRDVRDSLAVAAGLLGRPELAPWGAPEEATWILGAGRMPVRGSHETAADGVRARLFPQAGYIIIRGGADRLVFDVGPHGYLNGGHAHADALAVTLDLDKTPLLIDPGTGTYTMDPALRDRMRSSAAHNTLTLNGASSSTPSGPFHWETRTDARLEAWRTNGGFCWAEGAHDGFRPAGHRRSVVRVRDGGWLILDEVLGDSRHRADLHWHFDPGWVVSFEAMHRVRLTSAAGTTAWMAHEAAERLLAFGDRESGLGWYSPVYGATMPASVVRLTHEGPAPFSRATWIGSGEAAPVLERVRVDSDPIGGAIALRVRQGDGCWTTVLRPGESAERESRNCSSVDYRSDARLMFYATRGGTVTSLALADASHALALHDGLVSVAAETHVQDLHLAIGREQLELLASAPPPRLRLQGGGLSSIRTIRVNGREHRRESDTIELLGSDWPVCVESPASSI
jgi:hypothetical protein